MRVVVVFIRVVDLFIGHPHRLGDCFRIVCDVYRERYTKAKLIKTAKQNSDDVRTKTAAGSRWDVVHNTHGLAALLQLPFIFFFGMINTTTDNRCSVAPYNNKEYFLNKCTQAGTYETHNIQ